MKINGDSDYKSKSLYVIVPIAICQIVFFFLKLFDVIKWDWILVLAPIWIPYFAMIASVLLVGVFFGIANIINKKW